MTPARPLFACLALAIALSGCTRSIAWTKPDADKATARADLDECRSLARSAVSRDVDIETDILSTRGRDWLNSGSLQTKKNTFANETRGDYDDVLQRCMTAKGYVPAK